MKSAAQIQPKSEYHRLLQQFDLRELDNPDPYDGFRLKYLARFKWLLQRLESITHPGAIVVDVGCAQGNISLTLAEMGRLCVAVDANPDALSYSRLKWERGTVWWVAADAGALPLRDCCADAVVMGEIIEHCPDPAALRDEAFRILKPGGWLLCTTPNGRFVRNRTPDFFEAPAQRPEHLLDHVCSFNRASLRRFLAEGGFVVEEVALLASALAAQRLRPLRRALPSRWAEWAVAVPCCIPVIGDLFCYTVAAAARKPE